jgi:CO/xanthine dehydrogenase Mo-binding subunit
MGVRGNIPRSWEIIRTTNWEQSWLFCELLTKTTIQTGGGRENRSGRIPFAPLERFPIERCGQGAAEAANWSARPSPNPQNPKTGTAKGRGFGCVAYESGNGYCAMVAEVEVDRSSGKVPVKQVVTANDAGPISNPDGIRNQIEGGTLQGMSRALMEEVTWDDQKVTSFDWRTYHTLPLGFDVPTMETLLINRPDKPACGAGEQPSRS